jgi:ATP-dependent Clp protease ATP-binding subunit ClpA
MVENPLAEEMLQGRFKSGDHILVDTEDDQIVFRVGAPTPA